MAEAMRRRRGLGELALRGTLAQTAALVVAGTFLLWSEDRRTRRP